MHGFLLINKPAGPTSHDVIDQLRRITGIRQIGHAGTLDPFADGLLIVGVGQSTKLLKHFVGLDKQYRATLRLGATSETYDRAGNIKIEEQKTNESDTQHLTPDTIQPILSSFLGKQLQTPPMYSAKKVGGKKLYELARQGKIIERKPNGIEIYSIEILSYEWPYLTLGIHCSSGTYIRTLGHDIGQTLGCGAYVESLTRTAIGDFTLEDSLSLRGIAVPKQSHETFNYKIASLSSTERITHTNNQETRTNSAFSICNLSSEDWSSHLILSPQANSTIMVFGVFDILHKGHEYFFQQAKKFGSRLIIVLTTDNNVFKQKKKPPTYTQQERLQHIKALKYTDEAYIGDETDYFALIQKYKPNLICLGYDQTYSETQLRQELKEHGLATHVLRLDSYKPELYKSSIIKRNVAKCPCEQKIQS